MSQVLNRLIEALRILPGVGPRSAQRMAYQLLQHEREGANNLANSLKEALSQLQHCSECNTFTEWPTCERCTSSQRDASLLCIVESPTDMNAVEQTHAFRGKYYILMGRISPLDGVGRDELGLDKLVKRLQDEELREVVIATSLTQEGEVTAHFLQTLVQGYGLTASRIARGLPIGSELEYADLAAVAQSLLDRQKL